MDDYEHIELTSEGSCNPNEVDHEENEQKFMRKFRNEGCTFDAVNEATDEGLTIFELPEVRSAQYVSRALISGKRSENLDMARLRRIFGGVSDETVKNKTLSATTHMIQRSAAMPIHNI